MLVLFLLLILNCSPGWNLKIRWLLPFSHPWQHFNLWGFCDWSWLPEIAAKEYVITSEGTDRILNFCELQFKRLSCIRGPWFTNDTSQTTQTSLYWVFFDCFFHLIPGTFELLPRSVLSTHIFTVLWLKLKLSYGSDKLQPMLTFNINLGYVATVRKKRTSF